MANLEFDSSNENASPPARLDRDYVTMDSNPDLDSHDRLLPPALSPSPLSSFETAAAQSHDLRALAISKLRQEGYRYREIAEVMGITKQRVNQIERQLTRPRASKRFANQHLQTSTNAARVKASSQVRSVTADDFEKRLNAINACCEEQLGRILKRGYNRQRLCPRARDPLSTLFWKVWPLIEVYEFAPFSFSKLVGDFPVLAEQPHLPQLLSRLRRKGLLRRTGSVRIEGQNLPEVMMAQTPIDRYLAPEIEKLVAKWILKLRQLNATYRPNGLDGSIESIRNQLIQVLVQEGRSADEIERVFGARQNRKSSNFDRLAGNRESAPTASVIY